MDFTNLLQKRRFSIILGFTVGLTLISLFNIAGLNPARYISMFNSTNFFIESNLMGFIISMTPLSIAIISAGIVTFLMLSEKKRSCIFGGITGMLLIFISMLISYSSGVMQFPIESQVVTVLGSPGIILVFFMYAVPITMLGFILGYFGSFLTEKFSYDEVYF